MVSASAGISRWVLPNNLETRILPYLSTFAGAIATRKLSNNYQQSSNKQIPMRNKEFQDTSPGGNRRYFGISSVTIDCSNFGAERVTRQSPALRHGNYSADSIRLAFSP
jgi:hypothetical protein